MNIKPDCLSCIYSQVLRVGHTLDLDIKIKQTLMRKSLPLLENMSFDQSPPKNALAIYDMIADELKTNDIYKDVKNIAIMQAKEYIPIAKDYINSSSDKFNASLKVAVAGNVIDLASKEQYDFKTIFVKLLQLPFFIDNSVLLFEKLQKATNVVYLADNAGENIFDEIFLQTLNSLFAQIKFYYFVRSKPIINDITYNELEDSQINNYAKAVDSGVPTPGFLFEYASKEAKELIENADFVISKGMGNYECLSDEKCLDIFYLLKVKCDVVSQSIKAPLGSLVCMYQKKENNL